MSHYIYDNTSLQFPKVDLEVLAPTANRSQYIIGDDWNITCQALEDVKSMLQGAKWYGVLALAADPVPSGVSDYLWVSTAGILNVKRGGTNNQVVYAARQVLAGGALDGGGALNADITLDMALLSPSPAGSYSRASIVVDQYGRVISASSNAPAGYTRAINDATTLAQQNTFQVDGTALVFEDDPVNSWTHLRLADQVGLPRNDIQTTPTAALVLKNTAAATAPIPDQFSPSLELTGTMWNGSASADTRWDLYNLTDSANSVHSLVVSADGSPVVSIGSTGYVEMENGASAAVSPSGKCRLRYNNSTHKLEVSLNGATYAEIATV